MQSEALRFEDLHRGVVQDTRIIDLEVESSGPFVDNVQHRLLFDGGGKDKRDDTQHSQASVDDFSFFRESGFEVGHVSVSRVLLGVLIRVQQESISKSRWADSGHK